MVGITKITEKIRNLRNRPCPHIFDVGCLPAKSRRKARALQRQKGDFAVAMVWYPGFLQGVPEFQILDDHAKWHVNY